MYPNRGRSPHSDYSETIHMNSYPSYIMITIVHGDDIAASRNYFISLKMEGLDSVTMQGTLITLTDIIQAVEGSGLFSEGKHIFIEELLSKRKAGKELNTIIECLISNEKENEIVLWESKDVTTAQLRHFKNPIIKQFKVTKTIFQFVDSLKPHNAKNMMSLFHKTIEAEDVEYVFFMIVRQVRLLLALSNEGSEQIDEIKRMAPWQKSKLQKQSKLFTIDGLLSFYQKLFGVEYGIKTGNLSLPLVGTIDFLLIEL